MSLTAKEIADAMLSSKRWQMSLGARNKKSDAQLVEIVRTYLKTYTWMSEEVRRSYVESVSQKLRKHFRKKSAHTTALNKKREKRAKLKKQQLKLDL